MNRNRIFVLDVGKTNLKAAVFDAGGAQLFERSARNAPLPGPPYPHADTDKIWAFCLAALREAGDAHAIDAIVVTTHGATGALIGEDRLALPVLDYEHAAVEEIEGEYASLRPPFNETLSPPLSVGLNLGRQLAWQARRFPEAFARAKHLLMYSQYFSWRLTGVAALEATSLGAHTDLWRPQRGGPSSLTEALSLTKLLPPMARAYDIIGKLKPAIVKECGLKQAPDVFAGIHDSNASILPHLARRAPPFTVVSSGTWVILFGLGLSLDKLDPARDQLANIDVEGRPIACARFMGGREYAAIAGADPARPAISDVEDIMRRGVFALPNFAGGSGPFPNSKARIDGEASTREARAGLATLYAALMTDYALDLLGAKQGDLLVEGSFADNEPLCALLAALRPAQAVIVSRGTAGTARGAAMLANWPPAAILKEDAWRAAEYADAAAMDAYRREWRRRVWTTGLNEPD
jgi:sugar (pentulose or hexulose) kinase